MGEAAFDVVDLCNVLVIKIVAYVPSIDPQHPQSSIGMVPLQVLVYLPPSKLPPLLECFLAVNKVLRPTLCVLPMLDPRRLKSLLEQSVLRYVGYVGETYIRLRVSPLFSGYVYLVCLLDFDPAFGEGFVDEHGVYWAMEEWKRSRVNGPMAGNPTLREEKPDGTTPQP